MAEDDGGQSRPILCRVERAKPGADWERSWRLARLPGLGPENTSFIFKLMHEILPTQERVARTKPRASPSCTMPGCTAGVSEDLAHALVLCESNDGVGQRVMTCLRTYAPTLDTESALRLEFDVDEEMSSMQSGKGELRNPGSSCTRSGPKWKPRSTSSEKPGIETQQYYLTKLLITFSN